MVGAGGDPWMVSGSSGQVGRWNRSASRSGTNAVKKPQKSAARSSTTGTFWPMVLVKLPTTNVGGCTGLCVGLGITPCHLLGSTLLDDNKQQELTSLILETPLPTRIAVIGYTGQCDTVAGKQTVRSTLTAQLLCGTKISIFARAIGSGFWSIEPI